MLSVSLHSKFHANHIIMHAVVSVCLA